MFVGDARRAEAKEALLKRLGMRGPASNMTQGNQRSVAQFDSPGNMMATNPFADTHSTTQNFTTYHGSQVPQVPMSSSWNPAGNQNWTRGMPPQTLGRIRPSPGGISNQPQHHSPPGTFHQPKHSPSAGNQYNTNIKPLMSSYQMPAGNRAIHNQYIARNQPFGQVHCSSQSQLSPGSYQGKYLGSQGFDIHTSEQMSPPYISQSVHQAQAHCNQSSVQYSMPVTCTQSQLSQRTSEHSRFMQSDPGQYQHSTGSFAHSQKHQAFLIGKHGSREQDHSQLDLSESDRANEMQTFHSTPYTRANQIATHAMSIANQTPELQSHDLTITRTNQLPIQAYAMNSDAISSPESDLHDPYLRNSTDKADAPQVASPMPMYTAQPMSAITSSQTQNTYENFTVNATQQNNSGYLLKGPNPAVLSNRNVVNVLDQGNPMFQHGSQQQEMGTDTHRDVRKFLGTTLMQRQQNACSLGQLGEFPSAPDTATLRQDSFSQQTFHEGAGYILENDSSPQAGQQLSPRTPAGDSGLQSPGSTSSKLSEPFVGPVGKFYPQKRLVYEQISPPVTPVCANASDIKKPQSASSTSSGFSEPQISPLHRLLIDNSDFHMSRPDQRQRSPSRSSISSLSSIGSEKPINQTQPDVFHPALKKPTEKPRLFDMLINSKIECDSRKEVSDSNENTSQSLNDSQQDLFANSLLSDIGSVENTTADSLTSLFSDDAPINSIGHRETVGPLANSALSTPSKDVFATLSSLESFVGSVRNESAEFGVNFNKTSDSDSLNDAVQQKNTPHGMSVSSIQQMAADVRQMSSHQHMSMARQMSGHQQMTMERQLSCQQPTAMERLPQNLHQNETRDPPVLQQSHGRLPPILQQDRSTIPPVIQQNQGKNCNLENWPLYSSQTSALTKPGRGKPGQKRRGRPPIKKCLSFPGETSGINEKKRKSRSKKKSGDFSNPPSFQQHGNIHTSSPGSQYSQQFQNCFPVPSNNEISPNIDLPQNLNMNMPYYANQQSFSQLLEGDGSDLLTEFTNDAMAGQESQFGDNVDLLQGDQPSLNQYTTALAFHQNTTSADKQYPVIPGMIQEHFATSLSNNQIDMHPSTDNFETCQPDRMSLEHHGQQYPYQLHQEHFQQHTLPEQDQLSTINLSEAMQISEPTANFEPEFTNLCTEDVTHIMPELENDQCGVITQKVNIVQLPNMNNNQFITKSLKNINMQIKQQQKQNLLSKVPHGSGDLASIMELIKYRQRSGSPPKPSAAYTFRFKVPTPIFKRLKFRIKRGIGESVGSQLDFVRMHPKDARKYSLLKIGREVIRLQNISGETIECIREKLKAGEDVEGIPPSIRLVEIANILQTPSIIANLLSAEDPLSEDLIGTGNLEDILQGSLSLKMANFENNVAFMMKKERKLLLTKDKRINSMFKSGNLSNIPHLKKYRAGFPYFGKGHVGKGDSSAKVRPNNKGLKPEYEDDENIVIKDVCLNDASDGVLTPIKSRTPLAGRSPAHYGGGGNMPETENQEKTMLESKLKDIEYDMELKQSSNSQIFHDVFIGDKELQHKVDYDNVAQEQDVKDGLILDKAKVMDTDEETNESVAAKVEPNVNTANSTNFEADGDEIGINVALNENLKPKRMCEKCDTDIDEDVKMKIIVDDNNYKCMKENCNSGEIENMNITFGKFKKHLEKTLSLKKDDHENSTVENGCLASYGGINIGARNIRSRSSSIDSQLIPSRSSSRQNSVILSGMSCDEDQSFLSSVESVKRCQSSDESDYNSDSKKVKHMKLGTYRSSSACSRKSSWSSSLDQDTNKKKCRSRKSRKKPNRHQNGDDSDGIPGVDYIVVNRFKGHKELRVVVEKLKVLHDSEVGLETLNCGEKRKNGFNSRLNSEHPSNNGVKYQKDDSNVKTETKQSKLSTGFSAEFEKFLASQTYPQVLDPDSDSDTQDCDFPDGMDCQNSASDKSKIVNDERSQGNRSSGTEISQQSRRNIVVSRTIEDGEAIQDDLNVTNEAMLTDQVSVEAERSERANFTASHEGEFSCSKNSSCSVVYKQDKHYTNVSSLTGLRDFSSSSEDEHNDKQRSIGPNTFQQKQCKSDGKRKKVSKSIHDGSVFCSKARKKRKKIMPRPSKLMCTLSVLHDATLEKLTSAQAFSDMETGTSSSSQSPAKSRDLSDIDSPIRWQVKVKTPDFEIYSDRTNDHLSMFEDTMYKLAYLSPMSSDGCCDSPPQPLSPKEMRTHDCPVEHSSDKIVEHNEKKMTLSNILKTMQVESELNKDMETNNGKIVEAPSTPSKIAVAKTETLTFSDIKSFCLAEKDNEDKNLNNKRDEIEDNRTDSPPPDLGPPVLESETDVKLEDGSPPPQLSPNRTESECDFESSLIRETNIPKIGVNNNIPPFLTPCRSPRVALSPRYSSPRCLRAQDGIERSEYFSLPVERESGIAPGRSPGACSSSGSINVIHSEEFSDISDENDSDHDSGFRKHNRLGKPKYTNSPTMPSPSTKFGSDFKAYSGKKNSHLDEKERKLRDIHEFEERLRKADEDTFRDKDEQELRNQERLRKNEQESMRKADENRNNIFELMSSRNIASISQSTDQNQSSVDLNLLHRNNLPSEIQNVAKRLKKSVSEEFNDYKHIFKKSVYGNGQRLKLDLPLHSGTSTNYSQNTSPKFQNSALNGVVQKKHHKNGDYGFYNQTSDWNAQLNSSMSQRNFQMNHYQHINDSHEFQSMSLDLNHVALERRSSANQKHLSPPQTNVFDNFSVSSQQSEKGINSGDLFESCSDGIRHRTLPSFNRSLSENARSEYNIVRSNRLNDTIMKSVQNYANRDKAKQDFNNSAYNDIPLLEFGRGDGKRKHNVNKSDHIKTTTTQSQMPGSFHHKEEDDLGGSHGNGGRDNGQSPETFDGSNITTGCQVITPHTGPPSLECILESANQHGLAAFRPTGAYYSNYGDVTEKPRYIGIDLA